MKKQNLEWRKSIVEAATTYIEMDFFIIPIKPGEKAPLIKEWPNKATNDLKQVKKWLETWPDMNIGIVTGEKSGVWVLDIDVKNEAKGNETLAILEKCCGKFETLRCRTWSGGEHIYFKYPLNAEIKNSVNKLPGIDIRGDGGQVVVPPSIVKGKQYKWRKKNADQNY